MKLGSRSRNWRDKARFTDFGYNGKRILSRGGLMPASCFEGDLSLELPEAGNRSSAYAIDFGKEH